MIFYRLIWCWKLVSYGISLCQRLCLTQSVKNNPWARSASIERQRRESPPEANGESFARGARGFAKQNHLFIRRELTHKSKAKPWQKANMGYEFLSLYYSWSWHRSFLQHYKQLLLLVLHHFTTPQISSCSHCAVTRQWRCGDYSFNF